VIDYEEDGVKPRGRQKITHSRLINIWKVCI